MVTDEKPKFLLAAEELARQRGMEPEEILQRDRTVARNSGYPGPECLLPDEIETFYSDESGLGAERANHVAECPACSSLLASAEADPAEIRKILDLVKSHNQAQGKELVAGERTSGLPTAPVVGLLRWASALAGAATVIVFGFKRLKAAMGGTKSLEKVQRKVS